MLTGSLNTNLSALAVERRLRNSSSTLEGAFERLSSGLRIGSAGDDAAGLAVSSILNVDTRVYAQAVRNLNDAVGVLNVQEGALQELTTLSIRQRELATQAANGVLSPTQRAKLNQESQKLSEEYERIVATTSFNGQALFAQSGVQIQAGYGSLNLALGIPTAGSGGSGGSGSPPPTSAADGTFGGRATYATTFWPSTLTQGDVNGDGRADLVVGTNESDYYGTYSSLSVFIGGSGGAFQAPIDSNAVYLSRSSLDLEDFNNDGRLDAVSVRGGTALSIAPGNNTGLFNTISATIVGPSSLNDYTVADFNGDSKLDIAATFQTNGGGILYFGNGDGTFAASLTFTDSNGLGVSATDLDGNGTADLIYGINGTTRINVRMGNGDGTFRAAATYMTPTTPIDIQEGDFNGDGEIDLLLPGASPSVLLGNGDGSFKTAIATNTASVSSLNIGDLNGDGRTDVIGTSGGTVRVYISNGDGSFKAPTSYAASYSATDVVLGDFNGDSVLDFAASSVQDLYLPGAVDVYFGNSSGGSSGAGVMSSEGSGTATVDLRTMQSARESMQAIDSTISAIQRSLGTVGAGQSRLQTSLANLAQAREDFAAAGSRITDVDVAQETAALTRSRILQQSGVAVLAQANEAPRLLLGMLT